MYHVSKFASQDRLLVLQLQSKHCQKWPCAYFMLIHYLVLKWYPFFICVSKTLSCVYVVIAGKISIVNLICNYCFYNCVRCTFCTEYIWTLCFTMSVLQNFVPSLIPSWKYFDFFVIHCWNIKTIHIEIVYSMLFNYRFHEFFICSL